MWVVIPAISIRLVACLVCLLATVQAHTAQQDSRPHAQVELLSRQASAVPGSDVQLGLHFVLEPGWHIYWTNPGDSGQPPVLKWQLPAGFHAGEIQWPYPERMQTVPQLADFGYHDDVLLPVILRVPRSSAAGSPVPIGLEAKWLICREVCIPEHAQLRLSLPVSTAAKMNAKSAPLFDRAKKLLPQPLPHSWKASATSTKDKFVLSISAGKPVRKALFFPLEPGQVDNAAPQELQPWNRGIRISMKKSDLLLNPIPVLRGVLVIDGSSAYRIEAPVRQPIQ
jgi:DsbC/DsbD-like thiol-disulfide interchange protein